MANVRNSDGLSTADKMEMNLTKIDAGICHMADSNQLFELNFSGRFPAINNNFFFNRITMMVYIRLDTKDSILYDEKKSAYIDRIS